MEDETALTLVCGVWYLFEAFAIYILSLAPEGTIIGIYLSMIIVYISIVLIADSIFMYKKNKFAGGIISIIFPIFGFVLLPSILSRAASILGIIGGLIAIKKKMK